MSRATHAESALSDVVPGLAGVDNGAVTHEPNNRADPVWDAAWEWVLREHENRLDSVSRAELIRWLEADPRHRSAHAEACEIWLACALLPPVQSGPDDR